MSYFCNDKSNVGLIIDRAGVADIATERPWIDLRVDDHFCRPFLKTFGLFARHDIPTTLKTFETKTSDKLKRLKEVKMLNISFLFFFLFLLFPKQTTRDFSENIYTGTSRRFFETRDGLLALKHDDAILLFLKKSPIPCLEIAKQHCLSKSVY